MTPLLLLASLAAPTPSGLHAPEPGDAPVVAKPADRLTAARLRSEMSALQVLCEAERGRRSGTRVRDVVDGKGHRLVLMVTRESGALEIVHTFEPGTASALYALILDAESRVRFLLVEPKDKSDRYEIDQILFQPDGMTAVRDHLFGTFVDCADGRLHDRRIVTVFGPSLRVLERSVEFPDDPPSAGSRLTEGCALEAAGPTYPDAASYLRAYHLEGAAREAGLRFERRSAGAQER